MSGESGHRIYRRLLGIVKRYRLVFGLSVLAVAADAGGHLDRVTLDACDVCCAEALRPPLRGARK